MALDDCALAPKLDPVRERFAQEYHATGNASEAFRRANPKAKKWKQHSLHVEASKVLSEPEVSLRLEQLQAEAAKRHGTTIDSLTAELETARDGAMSTGQFSPPSLQSASRLSCTALSRTRWRTSSRALMAK